MKMARIRLTELIVFLRADPLPASPSRNVYYLFEEIRQVLGENIPPGPEAQELGYRYLGGRISPD